jgi:hypothetical protein
MLYLQWRFAFLITFVIKPNPNKYATSLSNKRPVQQKADSHFLIRGFDSLSRRGLFDVYSSFFRLPIITWEFITQPPKRGMTDEGFIPL